MSGIRRKSGWILGIACAFLGLGQIQAQDDNETIAAEAYNVLKKRCYDCHGAEIKAPGLLVLEVDMLTKNRGEDLNPFVTPGHPEKSELWYRMSEIGDMPPAKVLPEGMPDAEKAIIKKWIEAGAPKLAPTINREFLPESRILKAISNHLFNKVTSKESQRFQRYFSIAHLHNNKTASDLELRLYRAALSKAINSMSRSAEIVVPQAVDDTLNTVYVIDLRSLGWEDIELWDKVVKAYPYGIKPLNDESSDSYERIKEIYGVFFDGVPYIRADWFIVKATRPPLYYDLVGVPDTLGELEKKLEVDLKRDFEIGRLQRAGMFESGVSSQNRLVERRPSRRTGMFWISYDFKSDSGRSNLARFPLGPKFEGNQFAQAAFEHDGGELIWQVPNGLHAYMLCTSDGKRIDAGPVEIVYDATNTSGSPLIVNGISCMNCHKYGTIPLRDDIREGHALLAQEARNKVRELFPPNTELERILDDDRQNYLRSLRKAMLSFLAVDEDAKKDVTEFPEPISTVARLYQKNLGLEEAARELGLDDPTELKGSLGNRRLLQLGLGPLQSKGGSIKRSFWDSSESSNSVYQEAASELGIGTPVN